MLASAYLQAPVCLQVSTSSYACSCSTRVATLGMQWVFYVHSTTDALLVYLLTTCKFLCWRTHKCGCKLWCELCHKSYSLGSFAYTVATGVYFIYIHIYSYSYIITWLCHVYSYAEILGFFIGSCSTCSLQWSLLLVGSSGVDKERPFHCSSSYCTW